MGIDTEASNICFLYPTELPASPVLYIYTYYDKYHFQGHILFFFAELHTSGVLSICISYDKYYFQGHEYPERRVKYSPFVESQLASVSYDFTTR